MSEERKLKNCVCARKTKLTIHSITELMMALDMGLIDGKGTLQIDFMGDIVKKHGYLGMKNGKLVQGIDLGFIKIENHWVGKGYK